MPLRDASRTSSCTLGFVLGKASPSQGSRRMRRGECALLLLAVFEVSLGARPHADGLPARMNDHPLAVIRLMTLHTRLCTGLPAQDIFSDVLP